jgi:Transposase IS66 family
MILFEKFGQHQPLNRQAERYAREGVELSLSTLADQVGACCAVLDPLFRRLEAHTLAAERLHGDDTTVPHSTRQSHAARCSSKRSPRRDVRESRRVWERGSKGNACGWSHLHGPVLQTVVLAIRTEATTS